MGATTTPLPSLTDWRFEVATTELQEVLDSLDEFPDDLYPDSTGVQFRDFVVRPDTVDLPVTLPRIVRFSGSAWANRILQLDVSATLTAGDFDGDQRLDLAVLANHPNSTRLGVWGESGVGIYRRHCS